MGKIIEKDNRIDVICQHSRDGAIIPIKIRIADEDGEFQTYVIRSYKDLTGGDNTLPNGIMTRNHIRTFECKIAVFDTEKRIRIIYNTYDSSWRISL